MIHFLKRKPLYLFLFPLFFVTHGYADHYNAVPADEALWLLLWYTGGSMVLTGTAWLYFRSVPKAALFTFILLMVEFFFGSGHDQLKRLFPDAFFLRYRFILPVLFICLLLFIRRLKKSKIEYSRIHIYLNSTLLVFLVIEAARLVTFPGEVSGKFLTKGNSLFRACDTCKQPDVYLIIPDQYTGGAALRNVFGFDNSAFENALKQRNFHIPPKSVSNYNLTPYSVASVFSMDYLDLKAGKQNYGSVSYSYRVIRENRVLQFFKEQGYHFYNCSIFDIDGQAAREYGAFLPYGVQLITSQTFTKRLISDFQSDVARGKFGLKKMQEKILRRYLNFNNEMMEKTRQIAAERNNHPKFVYTHLMMPHHPYYFDSRGRPMPAENISPAGKSTAPGYIEYLQYCNNKLLTLVDDIFHTSESPPIILLLSDHGLRHPDKKTGDRSEFMNLSAVFLPGGDYEKFYDSISNVNQFRVLLNSCFGQQLPILKDSVSNVWD